MATSRGTSARDLGYVLLYVATGRKTRQEVVPPPPRFGPKLVERAKIAKMEKERNQDRSSA